MEVRRGKQRKANHADVKERRRKGRHREAVPGIEDRPHQRGQGDQQNIGEGNAQQLGGQRKFIGGISKPGGGDGDHPRRRQHPDNGDDRQGQGQQSGDIRDKHPGGIFALLAFIFGKDRHKRLREGAFGKNTPQQIRQFEGDEKGVGRHPGAKNARHNRIAGKAQHARKHGHRTDGRQ